VAARPDAAEREPAPPVDAGDVDAPRPADGDGGESEETESEHGSAAGEGREGGRRRRRRRRRGQFQEGVPPGVRPERAPEGAGAPHGAPRPPPPRVEHAPRPAPPRAEPVALSGVLELRPDGHGALRSTAHDLTERREDAMVPQPLVRRFGLREGMLIAGRGLQAPGKPGARLEFVDTVDGQPPSESRQRHGFKKLTVIDPDFHYELGTFKQDNQLSMRIVDLLCPIGRGQRGLVVAPPRTGKTTLLMDIAAAMEALYPDVHLIVLLVDERPEEGTHWKRSVKQGEVYVSTMDESPQHHVRLAELVEARAERLVETGKEVVILLDSITRMTRAYNNLLGGKNARTMSGGLDARVFQQPKHFFGAARNTENGGSLTILATALVDTGSKMDQVIYEEFKGTGNMELTLDRRLADRRVFPAIDFEHTGTRKEERLLGRATLKKVDILRRVLSRMKPREAMETLIDRLGRYASNQEFLNAFSLDDVA
jgi:transcription termination factor Rho